MKKFCSSLKKHSTEKINCEKKEMLPLTKKQKINTKNKNFATYAKNNFMKSLMKIETIARSGIIVITHGHVRGFLRVSLI